MVSVQPCFDKKLEASRRDFDHTAGGLLPEGEEVDLVLSTTEFWHLLEHIASTGCSNIDIGTPSVNSLSASSTIELDPATKVLHHLLYALQPDPMQGRDSLEGLFRSVSADGLSFVSAVDANAGSGGYAEYIFKHAALQLFEVDLFKYTEGKGEGKGEGSTERLKALPYKLGRGGKNPDMAEVDLQSCLESIDHGGGTANAAGGEGTIVVNGVGTGDRSLRFGRAYGFRNIQSVLNQLKKGKCNLDLVEVMACPSGCNNGGGQIKTTSKGSQRELPSQGRERVQQLEDLFHEHTNVRGEPTGGGSVVRCPDESPLVQRVYGNSSSSSSSSGNSENFLLSEQQRAMLLHTRYHAVPKLDSIAPLAAKW